jgi:hypothetical protein
VTTHADARQPLRANPGLAIVKLTNGTDNDTAPGPIVPLGQHGDLHLPVTNTGNVPLSASRSSTTTARGQPADDSRLTAFTGDTNGNGRSTWARRSLHGHAHRHAGGSTPTSRRRPARRRRAPPAVTTPPTPDNHFGANPGIAIVKLTNGTDNDTPPARSSRSAAR